MAEAPQPQGPPRKTTTRNRFSTMATQNEREGTKEDEFFWLENIMRVAPHKLHSVPGPSSPVGFFPLPAPPTPCTDATERGQQAVSVVLAFDQEAQGGVSPRSSWSHVDVSGTAITLYGDGNCGGGNMNYGTTSMNPPVCVQLNKFLNGSQSATSFPPIIDSNPSFNAGNALKGQADQFAYGFYSNSIGGAGMALYYPELNNHGEYLKPGSFGGFHPIVFAVRGNEVWISSNLEDPTKHVLVYNRATSALLHDFSSSVYSVFSISLTDNFAYWLTSTGANNQVIKRVDKSSGSVLLDIDISDISAGAIYAVNDSLIYIISATAASFRSYYWNGTDLIYIGKCTSISGLDPLGATGGQFINGTIYFNLSGTVNIFKTVIACPPEDGPVIASISVSGAPVAPGGNVTVNWADILLPDSNDKIDMRPSVPGSLGFVGTALASQSTGALGSGSMSFAIPGGTTPGDYILEIVTSGGSGDILIATSAPFTVT